MDFYGAAIENTKRLMLLIALPLWISGCSPRTTPSAAVATIPAPRPSATPSPARRPTGVYRVDIQADASFLAVGGSVTVTAAILGDFGNPMYAVEITDEGNSAPDLEIQLTPGNTIYSATGASAILALVSTGVKTDRVTATFQAIAPGKAAVVIAVNGEIVETDSSGWSFFNYETKFSDGCTISVVDS